MKPDAVDGAFYIKKNSCVEVNILLVMSCLVTVQGLVKVHAGQMLTG